MVTSCQFQGRKQDPNTLRIFLTADGLTQFAKSETKGFFLFACFLYGGSLKCAKLNSSVVFPENDPLFLGNLLSSWVAQMVKNLPAVRET